MNRILCNDEVGAFPYFAINLENREWRVDSSVMRVKLVRSEELPYGVQMTYVFRKHDRTYFSSEYTMGDGWLLIPSYFLSYCS